ncbi:MAG: hypothetical protein MKZ70_03815, partial [Opitutales bacterium]|nr:hypothetical protein [Opitutales bacterium]
STHTPAYEAGKSLSRSSIGIFLRLHYSEIAGALRKPLKNWFLEGREVAFENQREDEDWKSAAAASV